MKSIAIIPARGGSKRIPNKNIRLFHGKPIISYVIETSLQSGLFDEVMVSTDHPTIAEISQKYGAKVPFIRSATNADDFAGTEDVILEVLGEYKKVGQLFDLGCCIYPTAPLLTVGNLIEAKRKLLEENFDTVFPAVRFRHPVQRSFHNVEGKAKPVWPEYIDSRTQDLEVYFHDSGQYYWFRVESMFLRKQLFVEKTGMIELSEMETQDIDNLEDWNMAEMKFLLQRNLRNGDK